MVLVFPGRAVDDGTVPGADRCWSAPAMWWTRSASPCASGTPSGTITRTGASPMAGGTATRHRNPTPYHQHPESRHRHSRDPHCHPNSCHRQPSPHHQHPHRKPCPSRDAQSQSSSLGSCQRPGSSSGTPNPRGGAGLPPSPSGDSFGVTPTPHTVPPEAPAPSRDPAAHGPSRAVAGGAAPGEGCCGAGILPGSAGLAAGGAPPDLPWPPGCKQPVLVANGTSGLLSPPPRASPAASLISPRHGGAPRVGNPPRGRD